MLNSATLPKKNTCLKELEIKMQNNFLNMLIYVLAASIGIAALITLIALGATIFAVVFAYVFIPLLILAALRWLWLRYRFSKQGRIEYFDHDKF